MRRPNLGQRIYSYLLGAQRWYLNTPQRSLDEAYKAALLIKAIEDEHFNGKKIAPESADFGDSTMAYFQSELKKYLKIIRMRLTEFRASRSVFSDPNQEITKLSRKDGSTANDSFAIQPRNNTALAIEKLRFIDEIQQRYGTYGETINPSDPGSGIVPLDQTRTNQNLNQPRPNTEPLEPRKPGSKAEETSILPRSILSTLNRLKVELDPKAEVEVVNNFRSSQRRTLISVRLLILFILVPFLTFQVSRNLIVGPIIDHFKGPDENLVFLNFEMEERALLEMQRFEEKLKFESLMNPAERLSPEETENLLQEKVQEISQEFRNESYNAIKNVFADLTALGAFTWLLIVSKREIEVLKDFLDQVVYGLSDSAKAFIIILFTDMFVGFHSPHGWEVILEGVSRHLGLPENHDFIFLFIATFPVILDTIFKYWIFRYLNRISPSAVATYRNMNE